MYVHCVDASLFRVTQLSGAPKCTPSFDKSATIGRSVISNSVGLKYIQIRGDAENGP